MPQQNTWEKEVVIEITYLDYVAFCTSGNLEEILWIHYSDQFNKFYISENT